jgi:hypothetical protein
MGKVEGEFRFEIGDLVYPKAQIQGRDPDVCGWEVIERTVQQCYGGIQCHYHVRAFHPNGTVMLLTFTEPEVLSYDEATDIALKRAALNEAKKRHAIREEMARIKAEMEAGKKEQEKE